MVEAAREEARNMVESDPALNHFPILKSTLTNKSSKIHFE